MSEFVLVHGSGQNAESWSPVAELLRQSGHQVHTPELPKHAMGLKIEDYAAQIAKTVTQPGAVIVAHSQNGILLPVVAGLCDCALLVFVAAVIPKPGRCVRDQFTADPSMFSEAWIKAGSRWSDPTQVDDLASEFLFHDCDEPTRLWALKTMDVMSSRDLITELSPLDVWPDIPSQCLVASQDRTLSPDWIRRASLERLGREAVEIEAGHCPHMSRPAEVAAHLESMVANERN